MITENTAKTVYGGGGKYISMSLADLMKPQIDEGLDGMEIARSIIEKAGLEIIES